MSRPPSSNPILDAINKRRVVAPGAPWHNRAREQLKALRPSVRPPGPNLWRLMKQLVEVDPQSTLAFVEDAAAYGDIACIAIPGEPLYLINEPELIEEVLLRKRKHFIKSRMTRDLAQLVGDGLLTTHGDHWKKQRKLMSPPLQRKHIALYADAMVEFAERWVTGWQADEWRDVHKEMMGLTLEITVKTLFDADIGGATGEVAELLEEAMYTMQALQQTWRRFIPRMVPTPMHEAMRRIAKRLDEILQALIAERRREGAEGNDLLSLLIRARDDEGQGMSDDQLRDEVLTIFIAGHETTALALTYTLHLLGRHPDVAARIQSELDDVLSERRATASDVLELEVVGALVKESMRLYPPAWGLGREVIESVEIGQYTMPVGAQALICPYLIHRDERYFDEPASFDLDRWLDGRTDDLHRMAFMPFGGGPRICIGNHFAMMEIVLVIATFLQHVDVLPPRDEELVVEPSITLRPRGEVMMSLVPRG